MEKESIEMKKIGFIGAGNMAEALLQGVISSGVQSKKNILLSDKDGERLNYVKKNYGVKTTPFNKEVVEFSDLIVLAVKPGNFPEVLKEIKNVPSSRKTFISIAAGIKTSFISKLLDKKLKIARVMPNTPALVQQGASAIYFNENIDNEDKEKIIEIFEAFGVTEIVDKENHLDPVTGLSGSGPAFVSIFVEALADAGVMMGLSRKTALKLAAQTTLGTAKMILEASLTPADIKDMVSSPAGTTISGVYELEKSGFRGSVIQAVKSATKRAEELSSEDK